MYQGRYTHFDNAETFKFAPWMWQTNQYNSKTFIKGLLFELFCILYVDGVDFTF